MCKRSSGGKKLISHMWDTGIYFTNSINHYKYKTNGYANEINLANSVLLFHINKYDTYCMCIWSKRQFTTYCMCIWSERQPTRHDIAEILLMLVLNSNQSNPQCINFLHSLLLISVEIILSCIVYRQVFSCTVSLHMQTWFIIFQVCNYKPSISTPCTVQMAHKCISYTRFL